MDLSDLIARNADFTPDKVALRFGGQSLSYAAFAARIVAAARALKSQLGVARGDRVAILAANHPDYLVLLYACARLGAMLVPLNWRLAIPEQMFILTDASVKALMVEQAFAEIVGQLAGSVPLQARLAPGATLDAIAADRPSLIVLVPTTIQALIEHPGWPETD